METGHFIKRDGFRPAVLPVILAAFFLYVSNSIAQHTNVQVGAFFPEKIYYPNEPSIAINPKNYNQMVVTANGPLYNYYYSEDGGFTWNRVGNYSFALGYWGDPCVIADTSGNFYFFHLERLRLSGVLRMPDRIYCRKMSGDQIGIEWPGVSYTGLNKPKMQDKEWGVYDPKTGNLYVAWSEFDVYGSPDPNHFSNILFSRSTDGGETWNDPKRINEVSGDCLDGSNSVMGAMPAVGPNGDVYVSWPGPSGICINKSRDQGETWFMNEIVVADNPAGDHYFIPGVSRGGSCPVIACDLSDGPYRGTLYINWSGVLSGYDDTDIWLSKSINGGMTWSVPKRVNDDPPGSHQFFHWMTVDPTNGYLYFVFYDRRNYDDTRTDVYIAVSKDGGETFTNHKISETPFTPDPRTFMGDYSQIAAYGDVIRPVWARMDDKHVSVWTAIIDPDLLTDVEREGNNGTVDGFQLLGVYPNPFNSSTLIQYTIPANGRVLLKVYDIMGKEVETLFTGNQGRGEHRYLWNAQGHSSGLYFIWLSFGNSRRTEKVLIIR
jgi:hypothetical protein